jgi:hypothetical protein
MPRNGKRLKETYRAAGAGDGGLPAAIVAQSK